MNYEEWNKRLWDYKEKSGNGAGGPLHIYTDDGNCSQGDLEFCFETALEEGDKEATQIARDLLWFSPIQREKLYAFHWDHSRDNL